MLPFELVQSVKMHEEVAALRAKETRLSEIAGEYESHLDELSEEDKEQNFVNDAKDAFVAAEVKKGHQGAGGRTCHHEHPEGCGRAVCRGKDPEKSRSRTTVPPSTSAPRA